ncbi:MAG: nucleotide exchange factor GrpE [Patescibacteria group bacterium]|nr:nucleotide exchange factor GrpE [Patescibacteria group bacterium]
MLKKAVKTKENKKVSNLAGRVGELEDQLKRALADYHNLDRRIGERSFEWKGKVLSRIVDKLLEVYDDLCRAEKHLKERGLTIAVNQFWAVLESEGVSKIKTKEADFDPELMDCVEVVPGSENQVVETIVKGYSLNGKVIRPAKVKVGRGKG